MSLRLSQARVLVDTSVWVEHFRRGSEELLSLVEADRIIMHDFVIGELTLGTIPRGHPAGIELLEAPRAMHASHDEAMLFVRRHRLEAAGVGWVDVHLLASAVLSGASVWTMDRRMGMVARAIGVAHKP